MCGQKTLETREHLRIKIQTLGKEKLKDIDIAEKLGCSRRTVWKWKNRNFVKDLKRPRQPTKLSPITKRMIKHRLHQKTGSSVRNCATELNNSKRFKLKPKKIDFTTVHKFVKSTKWGGRAYKLTKEPLMSQKTSTTVLNLVKFSEEVTIWMKKTR